MAHRNMTGGTVYDTAGGRVMKDGTAYGVQKGKTMVDGTVWEIPFGVQGVHLECIQYDNRNGAAFAVSETETALSAEVRGGSGTDYSGVEWRLQDGREWYPLKKGDTVTYAFTGTRYTGDYASYGLAFFTDPNSAWSSYVHTVFNQNITKSRTYTVTTPCYCMFLAQVGGSSRQDLYATLNITTFKINGETVWVK